MKRTIAYVNEAQKMSGSEFNDKYDGINFVLLEFKHGFGCNYNEGINIRNDTCIHFIKEEDIYQWIHEDVLDRYDKQYVRPIFIPGNAKIYIEGEIFNTNKIILGPLKKINVDILSTTTIDTNVTNIINIDENSTIESSINISNNTNFVADNTSVDNSIVFNKNSRKDNEHEQYIGFVSGGSLKTNRIYLFGCENNDKLIQSHNMFIKFFGDDINCKYVKCKNAKKTMDTILMLAREQYLTIDTNRRTLKCTNKEGTRLIRIAANSRISYQFCNH